MVTIPAPSGLRQKVLNEAREQPMTKREIEALGEAMLKEHGLSEWTVRAVRGEDDTGKLEGDIEGSRVRCYYEEKLIWVNMRYADDAVVVREILLHEITHALLGPGTGHRNSGRRRRKSGWMSHDRDRRREFVMCHQRVCNWLAPAADFTPSR
jgi:hypothetical protein